MVLLDREPLALRCALLSAAASGLRLAAEGKLRDCGAATRIAEEGSGPPCCSSSLEPEPLQGWTRQQQQQQREGQREGQQGAGGGMSQSSDDGGAQVAAEAVSRTIQRVISGVERATAGAASGGTGSTVAGGAAAPPSASSDGEAARWSGNTADPSRTEAAAAAEAAPTFPTLVCSVTGTFRLPEFCFEGAAAITRLMEGQLPSSSSEEMQRPGGGYGITGEGDRVSIMGSVKGRHSSVEGSSSSGVVRARVFDWNHANLLGEQYDVLLACDVLYEDAAVGPIAALVPR